MLGWQVTDSHYQQYVVSENSQIIVTHRLLPAMQALPGGEQ